MSVITQNGDSALIEAARAGRTEVVSLLLKAGANIHLQNKVHQDNVDVCRENFCVQFVRQKGSKVSWVDIDPQCY